MYLQANLYRMLLYLPTIKLTSYCMITGALLKLFCKTSKSQNYYFYKSTNLLKNL